MKGYYNSVHKPSSLMFPSSGVPETDAVRTQMLAFMFKDIRDLNKQWLMEEKAVSQGCR